MHVNGSPGPYAGTFSIVARSNDGNAFGVAVCTARPAVGAMVPWVSLHGAVATQAFVNTELGRKGLALINEGVPVSTALQGMLDSDDKHEFRQIHGVDAEGTFAYTGTEPLPWAGHRGGEGYSVAGNILTGEEVLTAMAESFEEARQTTDFGEALMLALRAGQNAGGDKRGKQSASLLIADRTPGLHQNLRVDEHPDPVEELYRVFQVARAEDPQRTEGYKGTGSVIRVKL